MYIYALFKTNLHASRCRLHIYQYIFIYLKRGKPQSCATARFMIDVRCRKKLTILFRLNETWEIVHNFLIPYLGSLLYKLTQL